MSLRTGLQQLALMILTLCCAAPGRADDIDIYSNPAANTLQPPMTVIVLDMNLLGICDNVITNPNANATCGSLRNTLTLTNYLALIGGNGVLQNGIAALPLATLCSLNALLAVPIVSQLLCPTLSALGLSNLVTGLFNSALASSSVLLGALPSATVSILNAALSGPQKVLTDPSQIFAVLQSILTPLINSRVAIVISHANRSNTSNTPVTINGQSYACNFADLASIPGARASTTPCSNGAYFLLGFTNLADPAAVVTSLTQKITNALNPANLVTSLNGLTLTPANLTPPYQGKEAYDEIVHYLSGDTVYNAPLNYYDGLLALLTRDTAIESGANYVRPSATCNTVNVLNVQLTDSTGDGDSDADLRSARYFPGVSSFPDVVAAARDSGFTVNGNLIKLKSYFLIQDNLSSLAALQSIGANVLTYANIAGLLGLGQSIAEFMKPVLVTDAGLLTTSVAASRASATGLLEPAFLPEFRPKDSRKPSWDGNVKQLRLQRNATTGVYSFIAANGVAGISTTDGRINPAARTYWTRTTKLGGALVDGRTTGLGGAGQNIPGYVYNGGGNPGRVNADAARKLYYDQLSAANVPSLGGLDADTQSVRDALRSDLGVTGATAADDTLRRSLLLYARGFDVGTTSAPKGTGSGVTGVTGRPWLLGAVLHSRPVAVNYGARSGYSQTDPDIRVLFGSTDGFLHSVRTGHLASGSDAVDPSGVETWAFMPRATMSGLKTLRDDSYSPQFPYGVDGAPAVLLIDRGTSTTIAGGGPGDGVIDVSNSNDHAYAYFGLRRGGSNYYGLDITDPDSPRLIWRIGSDGLYSANTATPGFATGSAAWFAELGQTFSTPSIGRMRYLNSSNTEVERSVLLFAGGYNGGVDSSGNRIGKDLRNSRNAVTTAQVGTDDTRGNALYIVDALTGELIWKAVRSAGSAIVPYDATTLSFKHPMLADSIPSDVTAVDTDGDGLTDRLYVGDTGGRIWRADFPGSNRSTWTAGPIASLGRSHATADAIATNDRRFFHAPDYVPSRGKLTTTTNGTTTISTQSYDTIVIGSGDREDPFNITTGNWLYAIRDRDTASGKSLTDTTTADGVISSESDSRLFTQPSITDLTSACAASSVCAAGAALANGWRLQLTGTGEKAVSAPVTINNAVTLSTYTPPAASATRCAPDEGTSRIYGVNLVDSRPFIAQFINDGDADARSTAATAPGIAGEVTGLTPQLLDVNSTAINVQPPLTYRTFWRERREEEPERVKQ
ncbi:MAG: hypothetical protein NVS9B10_03130 [Nevskia sp.]